MNKKDRCFCGLLFALAVLIWLRDQSWMAEAENALPIAAALPAFWWLGRPWRFLSEGRFDSRYLWAGGALFGLGLGLDLTVLLALGWVGLLSGWLSGRLAPEAWRRTRRLLALPMLAFPWIALEGETVGWWFRLSGAWATEMFYGALGFQIEREGTFLKTGELLLRVDAACAGLNELQALLIAGTVVAYVHLRQHPHFKWSFLLLVAMAWASNTLRIIAMGLTAMTIGPEFASGAYHTWGGALVLCAMFAGCWFMFERLAAGRQNQPI